MLYLFLVYASMPFSFVFGLNASVVVADVKDALLLGAAPSVVFWWLYYIVTYAGVASRLASNCYGVSCGNTASADQAILADILGLSVLPAILGLVSSCVGVALGRTLKWLTAHRSPRP